MKILLLSQCYDPEPGVKVHGLAKSLLAIGHEVIVITGFPNYPSGKIYPGYKMCWRQWDALAGIKILRVPLYPSHSTSPFNRCVHYLSFAFSAAIIGPLLCGKVDLILAYSSITTVGIPALSISLLRKAPFVIEIQDLWPEVLFASNMVKSAWMTKALARIISLYNRFIYYKAKKIIVISPGFKRNLIAQGVPAEKIHVISNWAEEGIYKPVARDDNLAKEYGLAGYFNIIFGGNIGVAQSLGNVLNAAELLRDQPKIQFVLIGDGIEEQYLRKMASERKLANVRFICRQDNERMPYFFALADVLLLHLKRDHLFEITIPSKTIAYLACGKPILCCVSGDTADIIKTARAGLICPQDDPVGLADKVSEFYSMPENILRDMGSSARQTFLNEYTKSILIKKYEILFESIKRIKN